MSVDERFIKDLPDRDAAARFLTQLEEGSPAHFAKLTKNDGLLSDVLALISFSPLLATTLLQNPEYFSWLDRKRGESGVASKEELLESLARFALTNSQAEAPIVFARFRRRELLRIYLRDIRRLATIAEITEEISNLADATLEYALRLARNEMDGRFGQPQEADTKGRPAAARFCVAALGKLGSRELNYSSDIDLIFLYSSEGMTSGTGSRGSVTNREYFVKLAEYLTKLVGQPSGEGAAYRVDLRLRPHGSLGALAQSVDDFVRYYEIDARPWERQVMIRSRGCAGDVALFRELFSRIEHLVFSREQTVEDALANVRESKRRIDSQQPAKGGFDVKLGSGGIREIEFIAQALQLAHGGPDEWLRSPHTLISLDRLRDRGHISDKELSQLTEAYDFLRRTEHVLQMENGVQTHSVPNDAERRQLIGRRVRFAVGFELDLSLKKHTAAVARVFKRVFGQVAKPAGGTTAGIEEVGDGVSGQQLPAPLLQRLAQVSPHFASIIAANPDLLSQVTHPASGGENYSEYLSASIANGASFRERLARLRRAWSRAIFAIVAADVDGTVSLAEAKRMQTSLAEAAIDASIETVRIELNGRFHTSVERLRLGVLALGKLGGKGVDYDSDLDLVLVYDAEADVPQSTTAAEFFGRAAELLVTTLSSMTRDGHLYRVDLRLRPYGTKGLSALSSDAFVDYMSVTAAPWEMLAFVKLRAVGGDVELAGRIENETRNIIHGRAAEMDAAELRQETVRVRNALEQQRARNKRGGEVDIKYGAGGMLDVYFAARYLQLRHDVRDTDNSRATIDTLRRLKDKDVLSGEHYESLKLGYTFVAELDHYIRLTIGRSTRLPSGNLSVMRTIADRMNLASVPDLLEQLTVHRLAIRDAFEDILCLPR